MIYFNKKGNYITLDYRPQNGVSWIQDFFNQNVNKKILIKKAFSFNEKDMLLLEGLEEDSIDFDDQSAEFKLATLFGEYYRIKKRVLNLNHDIFIHKDINLNIKFFIAQKNISIFKHIDSLLNEDLYVGGEKENAIPLKEFERLIHNFPNDYELKKYAEARISIIIQNYVETSRDGEKQYNNYLNKKISKKGVNLSKTFLDNELLKYHAIYNKLSDMLSSEENYTEYQWQREIIQIILLLYPKYIHVFDKVPVWDTYNEKKRELDYLIVDSSGNIDIIEIKRPFGKCIVSQNIYRDNYIPMRELSGTVMQIEKYIFYLNKWGKKGEDELTKKYVDKLPAGFKIKITNPKAIIIMGRDNELTEHQRQDFEIIKRKFSNVIDIITYDDLLSRLRFTIAQLMKSKN